MPNVELTDSLLPSHAAADLVRRSGRSEVTTWSPVIGGANNRVWRGDTSHGPVLLKSYFQDEHDPRDRFLGEHSFYTLASRAGVNSVPRAFLWDTENRLGLFEFIEGEKLGASAVGADQVTAAARMVVSINSTSPGHTTDRTPLASEACFSPAQHLELVAQRVERLSQFTPQEEIDTEAAAWIRSSLIPAWQHLRELTASRFPSAVMTTVLSEKERWISPSDFGFHNALQIPNGRLLFFDFEYSGWDDPAKMICDFFCQPAIPVDLALWDLFLAELERCERWTPQTILRAQILLPVYQLKWSCIMLNEFLKSGSGRRQFAGHPSTSQRKEQQLTKARATLAKLLT